MQAAMVLWFEIPDDDAGLTVGRVLNETKAAVADLQRGFVTIDEKVLAELERVTQEGQS